MDTDQVFHDGPHAAGGVHADAGYAWILNSYGDERHVAESFEESHMLFRIYVGADDVGHDDEASYIAAFSQTEGDVVERLIADRASASIFSRFLRA
jgi:hypothetical protein